jgi:hypothetical protein
MTIISGTADHKFPIFVSIFIIVVWNMPKYPHLSPSLDQAIFWNLMLTLLQMAFLGSIFQKFSGGAFSGAPRTPLECLTPSALVCMTTHTTLASPLHSFNLYCTHWSIYNNHIPIMSLKLLKKRSESFLGETSVRFPDSPLNIQCDGTTSTSGLYMSPQYFNFGIGNRTSTCVWTCG